VWLGDPEPGGFGASKGATLARLGLPSQFRLAGGRLIVMNSESATVSALLKSARTARGYTIKAVAKEICVQSGYLKAIEAGAYDKLPADIYVLGYIRSFARMVGENADEMVAAFKKERGIASAAPLQKVSGRRVDAPKKTPGWMSPLVGLIGASMCWLLLGGSVNTAVFFAENQPNNTVEQAQLAAVQQNLQSHGDDTLLLIMPTVVSVDQPTQAVSPKKIAVNTSFFVPAAFAASEKKALIGGLETVISATEDSWVRLARTNGTEIWSGILRSGEKYRSREEGISLLSTSNAGGILLAVSGATASPMGARGEVIIDYVLGSSLEVAEAKSSVGSR